MQKNCCTSDAEVPSWWRVRVARVHSAEVMPRALKLRVVGGGASSLQSAKLLKPRNVGPRPAEVSIWNRQDMQLDGIADSMVRASANEDAGWCENPSGFQQDQDEQDSRNRSTSFAKAKGGSNELSGDPIWHPPSSVEGSLGEARAESVSLRRQRRPQRQSFLPGVHCLTCSHSVT